MRNSTCCKKLISTEARMLLATMPARMSLTSTNFFRNGYLVDQRQMVIQV